MIIDNQNPCAIELAEHTIAAFPVSSFDPISGLCRRYISSTPGDQGTDRAERRKQPRKRVTASVLCYGQQHSTQMRERTDRGAATPLFAPCRNESDGTCTPPPEKRLGDRPAGRTR